MKNSKVLLEKYRIVKSLFTFALSLRPVDFSCSHMYSTVASQRLFIDPRPGLTPTTPWYGMHADWLFRKPPTLKRWTEDFFTHNDYLFTNDSTLMGAANSLSMQPFLSISRLQPTFTCIPRFSTRFSTLQRRQSFILPLRVPRIRLALLWFLLSPLWSQ